MASSNITGIMGANSVCWIPRKTTVDDGTKKNLITNYHDFAPKSKMLCILT